MRLVHFTVSQVRVAATCPRIHWFDARASKERGAPVVTRIWRKSESIPGGGALFHRAVERFNAVAANSVEIASALESSRSPEQLQQALLQYFNENCLDLDAFASRAVPLRIAFVTALQGYMEQLARVAAHAREAKQSPEEVRAQLFGDSRKRVDVTFHLSADLKVHITGAIDYIFFDARLGKHRIVDYKLTPATSPNNDLFQVFTYALMHHHQHGTQPDVAVFYLHPERVVFENKWQEVEQARSKVYDLISSMVAWGDHAVGLVGKSPPGDLTYCSQCKYGRSGECERELGEKTEGVWVRQWARLGNANDASPTVEAQEPAPAFFDETEDEDPELLSVADIVPAQSPPAGASRRRSNTAAGNPTRKTRSVALKAPPRAEGLYVGQTETLTPVVLNPQILRTHVAVVGAAGSGKTWMAKVIAEEALRSGVPVLAIDPQGDLVQMLSMRDEQGVPEDLREQWRQFHERVETRIYTPGSSHGLRLSLDPVRLPATSDLHRIENPERRSEEEAQLLAAVANNLVTLCSAGGEENAQRTFVYQLLEAIPRDRAVQIRDIVSAISTPDILGLDDEQLNLLIRKTERERLARSLNAFVSGPSARLFQGGVRLDLSELLRPSAPGKVRLNVIYLNALSDDDQKHFFLAALATEVYRWMITNLDATQARTNLLFYIDEARDWIPAGGRRPPAKEPLIRLFTQGRKYGVGCLLCTQSPRSVDYNVFGNTSTKFIGRLEAAQDIDRVKDWFSNDGGAPSWIAQRNGAAKGTFVARWPDMPVEFVGAAFKGRQLFTNHEGAWSPDQVERRVDAAGHR